MPVFMDVIFCWSDDELRRACVNANLSADGDTTQCRFLPMTWALGSRRETHEVEALILGLSEDDYIDGGVLGADVDVDDDADADADADEIGASEDEEEGEEINDDLEISNENTDYDGEDKDDDKDKEDTNIESAKNKTFPSKAPEDDLKCPITLELPFSPVIAEDGRIYDREAIEAHIKSQLGRLKSPLTNQPMGDRLFPAPQIKSLIETLIEKGVIDNDLAASWQAKAKQAKEMETLQSDANKGDAKAMRRLGRCYRKGQDGFQKDAKLAYTWYSKAHDAGDVIATAHLGTLLCDGKGVAKCSHLGICYLTSAAEQGSDWAAYMVGKAFKEGTHGLPVLKKEAIRWLRKSLQGSPVSHHTTTKAYKAHAQKMLEQVQSRDE